MTYEEIQHVIKASEVLRLAVTNLKRKGDDYATGLISTARIHLEHAMDAHTKKMASGIDEHGNIAS